MQSKKYRYHKENKILTISLFPFENFGSNRVVSISGDIAKLMYV